MNRNRHIVWLSAVFFMMLSAVSCRLYPAYGPESGQLTVSLYVPGATMTRAETGMVNPLQEELKITSLQIWVFLSEDGTLISYKSFDQDLASTGLSNSTVTRFGMDLSPEWFERLTASPRPKVDVYAVANAASAVNDVPDEGTSRDALDQIVLDKMGGNWPLTRAVPEAGLPMSGVMKATDVSGDYPVLNVTPVRALKLIRAVSKIRFVFCQQGIPATETTPAEIGNEDCKIMGISFDGGENCQIASTERLFTAQSIDLGEAPGYIPLNASIVSSSGDPIIPNDKLSVVMDPEDLFFRGADNETETAEHYEARLDAAIAQESQVGPIYLRETDKTLSGTITYRISPDDEDLTARFSMSAGDVFSRNHTWIVYACFVEETMKLQLRVVVLPWEWTSYYEDYTEGTVNVIRRFTVFDTPTPTFKKVQTTDGFYDVDFWHTVTFDDTQQENTISGDIIIATPVGATLHIIPVAGKDDGPAITDAIVVSPSSAVIYPNYEGDDGRIEDCRIPIQIMCNPNRAALVYSDADLEGNYIDLHFCVETTDGRNIDLGSESIDYYRFRLNKTWNQ